MPSTNPATERRSSRIRQRVSMANRRRDRAPFRGGAHRGEDTSEPAVPQNIFTPAVPQNNTGMEQKVNQLTKSVESLQKQLGEVTNILKTCNSSKGQDVNPQCCDIPQTMQLENSVSSRSEDSLAITSNVEGLLSRPHNSVLVGQTNTQNSALMGQTNTLMVDSSECSVPYQPNVEIDNKTTTTTSISGTIHQIKGGNDNFNLYCEGQTKLNYTIDGDKYRIHNLEPGQRYRCQASTTFCHHTSARTNLIEECTVPYQPMFQIDSNSTTPKSISGTVHQIKGGSDKFTLYCEGQTMLNYTIDGHKYRIHDLEPGRCYRCQASSTFCQHTSARTNLIEECTVPDDFVVVVLRRTTDAISIAIRNIDNKMLSYTIYVNQTLYRKIPYASKVQNETISKLLPGMFYNIKIIGNTEQNVSKVLQIGAATYPSTPGTITVSQNKDFFVIKWEHSIGRVEFYKIHKSSVCTFASIHQVPFTAAMINGTTNELKLTTGSGVCCFLHVVAVSNNVSSSRKDYTIKHSEAVPGMVIHVLNTLSQNAITISWSEPSARNGVIIGYTLIMSSPDNRNIVKFKCIDCPDTNVCVPPVFVTSSVEDSISLRNRNSRVNVTRTYKYTQREFSLTLHGLKDQQNYSYSIYASTSAGDGPIVASTFQIIKDSNPKDEKNVGTIVALTATGSIIGTAAVLLAIIYMVYRYRRRGKTDVDKNPDRTTHYEDIGPDHEANHYETLEMSR